MAGIKRLINLHQLHPYWGVRRLALALSWSLNKTRRIKILAGVRTKLPKRTWCRPKKGKLAAPPPNLLPSGKEVLVEDFTHLGRFYLAVCMRLSTRQILSFKLSTGKGSGLVDPPPVQALELFADCRIVHSDQGSQYLAASHRRLIAANDLQQSCSAAGSPWQNGHVERLFKTLKYEFLGDTRVYGGDYNLLFDAVNASVFSYNGSATIVPWVLPPTPMLFLKNAKTASNLTTAQPVLKKVP